MIDEIDECWYCISVVPSYESVFPQILNGDREELYRFIEVCGYSFEVKWPSSLPNSMLYRICAANDAALGKNFTSGEVVDTAMAAESNVFDSEPPTLYVLVEKYEDDLTDEDDPRDVWIPDAPATKPVRVPFLQRVLMAVGF